MAGFVYLSAYDGNESQRDFRQASYTVMLLDQKAIALKPGKVDEDSITQLTN